MQRAGGCQDVDLWCPPERGWHPLSAPQVFFGGVIDHDKQHLTYRQNFRGCVENIMFNGVNIADLARHRRPNIRFEVQPGGRPLLWESCPCCGGDPFPGGPYPH